jgi:glycosyltransferase involved in cell wall biosynthesis
VSSAVCEGVSGTESSSHDGSLSDAPGDPAERSSVVPATVVLPTIGRPELVRACLESLAACVPRADEVLVVDSSADDAVENVVSRFAEVGARVLRCSELGLGHAFNLGLREAMHDDVLLTNDDCTVDPSWVELGIEHLRRDTGTIVTGRVRPKGDPRVVPSTVDDPLPHEYADSPNFVLYTQSMAVSRSELLQFGGFDGRIRPSAEDNDLSYRWLRSGRRIRYEPDFVVWHHDWRTPEQLERLYVDYGIGQGMVYGKHVRQGDLRMFRYVLSDLVGVSRAIVARLVYGPRANADPRLGLLRGLPTGLVRGWHAGGARPPADARLGPRGRAPRPPTT